MENLRNNLFLKHSFYFSLFVFSILFLCNCTTMKRMAESRTIQRTEGEKKTIKKTAKSKTIQRTEGEKKVKVVERDFLEGNESCKKLSIVLYRNSSSLSYSIIRNIKNHVYKIGGNVATTSFDFRGTFQYLSDLRYGIKVVPLFSRIPLHVYKCPEEFWKFLTSI